MGEKSPHSINMGKNNRPSTAQKIIDVFNAHLDKDPRAYLRDWEIADRTDVKIPSARRALTQLIREGKIQKKIDSNGNAQYFLTEKNNN